MNGDDLTPIALACVRGRSRSLLAFVRVMGALDVGQPLRESLPLVFGARSARAILSYCDRQAE